MNKYPKYIRRPTLCCVECSCDLKLWNPSLASHEFLVESTAENLSGTVVSLRQTSGKQDLGDDQLKGPVHVTFVSPSGQ